MTRKIVIHRGVSKSIIKTTQTTTDDISEEDYVEVEISGFTWFLANHGILWMELMTFPVAGVAIYCFFKNEDAWFIGLLFLFVFNTITSFMMTMKAYHKVFDDMV